MSPVGDVEEEEGRGEDDERRPVHVLLVPLHQLLGLLLAAAALPPLAPRPDVLEDARGRGRRRALDVLDGAARRHDGARRRAHRVVLDGRVLLSGRGSFDQGTKNCN